MNEDEKSLKEFLILLLSVTNANISFLDGLNIDVQMENKYSAELEAVQNTINNFSFVKQGS